MPKKTFEEAVLETLQRLEKGQEKLEKGQEQHSQDIRRVEVLQEEMRDDIIRIAEGVSGIRSELHRKADQQTVEDLAADIKTIQKAVKATNRDFLQRH